MKSVQGIMFSQQVNTLNLDFLQGNYLIMMSDGMRMSDQLSPLQCVSSQSVNNQWHILNFSLNDFHDYGIDDGHLNKRFHTRRIRWIWINYSWDHSYRLRPSMQQFLRSFSWIWHILRLWYVTRTYCVCTYCVCKCVWPWVVCVWICVWSILVENSQTRTLPSFSQFPLPPVLFPVPFPCHRSSQYRYYSCHPWAELPRNYWLYYAVLQILTHKINPDVHEKKKRLTRSELFVND